MIDTAIVYGAWACALFVGGVAIYATLEWLMGMTWRRMVRAAFVLTAGLIGALALALMAGCQTNPQLGQAMGGIARGYVVHQQQLRAQRIQHYQQNNARFIVRPTYPGGAFPGHVTVTRY